MKIFKLKDISEFIRNGVTIKQNISSKEGIPITRIETISKGIIDFDKLGYADIFEFEKYKDWLLKKGDILISHINSEKHLGKSAIFLDNDVSIIHGMNLLCIRVIDDIVFPEYLQLFFKTNQYKRQIKKIMKKSVNQASFSVNDFKEILIRLPKLDIQEKIIKKIMTLEKILENNKLKLKFLSELNKSLFTTMFGTPEYNEKGWNFISLKDISYSKGEYGSNKPAINYNGGYRYIRITDINATGELKTEKVGVSDEEIEAQKYALKENDILFARSGATVGKNFLYNKKYGKCIFAGYLIRFKLNPHLISTKYLKIYLDTNYYWNWVKNCQNIVAQPNINAKQYGEDLKIMLPPIELQNKFAERIEKIEKLSFEIEEAIKEAENLYNSLISKYFD